MLCRTSTTSVRNLKTWMPTAMSTSSTMGPAFRSVLLDTAAIPLRKSDSPVTHRKTLLQSHLQHKTNKCVVVRAHNNIRTQMCKEAVEWGDLLWVMDEARLTFFSPFWEFYKFFLCFFLSIKLIFQHFIYKTKKCEGYRYGACLSAFLHCLRLTCHLW